jgi:hypothetical protein
VYRPLGGFLARNLACGSGRNNSVVQQNASVAISYLPQIGMAGLRSSLPVLAACSEAVERRLWVLALLLQLLLDLLLDRQCKPRRPDCLPDCCIDRCVVR